jgi:hypothetical protein
VAGRWVAKDLVSPLSVPALRRDAAETRAADATGGEITLIADATAGGAIGLHAALAQLTALAPDGWHKHRPSFQLGSIKDPGQMVYLIAAMGE